MTILVILTVTIEFTTAHFRNDTATIKKIERNKLIGNHTHTMTQSLLQRRAVLDASIRIVCVGAPQYFTVPDGVQTLTVTLAGASGGDMNGVLGGYGGIVSATINVAPGDVLYVFVGGQGESAHSGYNGGGVSVNGGDGGGATDIRTSPYELEDRILVAGGGGGASGDCAPGGGGGDAGYYSGVEGGSCGYSGGWGANSEYGGGRGDDPGDACFSDSDGTFGLGGNSCSDGENSRGAGGGGYYGGGGSYYGGGGGGSGYSSNGYITFADGGNRGDGYAIIFFDPPTMNSYSPQGAAQQYTVPLDVSIISVTLFGASGGSTSTGLGGYGSVVVADISVNPGETLCVYVGGSGSSGGSGETSGGFNGGGNSY